jgi:hypothetical protein
MPGRKRLAWVLDAPREKVICPKSVEADMTTQYCPIFEQGEYTFNEAMQ